MRIFILVFVLEMFLIHSIAGIPGVIGVLIFLAAAVIAMFLYHEHKWRNTGYDDNDGIDNNGDDDGIDEAGDNNNDGLTDEEIEVLVRDGERLMQENPIVEITDAEWAKLLIELGLLPSTEVCDDVDNDCDDDDDNNSIKFLAMRRGRGQSWMGESDRRVSRLHPDNSWKSHRSSQWR